MADTEKQQLEALEQGLPTNAPTKQQKQSRVSPKLAALLSVAVCLLILVNSFNVPTCGELSQASSGPAADTRDLCPISPKVVPDNFDDTKAVLDQILRDEKFRNESAKKLSEAVKIPTEVTDQTKFLPVDDPSFDTFIKFHQYLTETFPKVHEHLKKETVNKHGLLYTWEGSDASLKPLLLTAHQDVVPVEWATEDKWTYYPYSGHFDGERVWGRGASDCKNLLIGLFESVELLLSKDFNPTRTVILAFGFDEEASGIIGAKNIGDFLYDRYGDDSIYALIDEGNAGLTKQDGKFFISVPTGEKGYLDSIITLKTPGGHSSVPPDHTSIGIVSQLVNLIEKTPFHASIPEYSPFLGYLQCYASYSNEIDPNLKNAILKAGHDKKANAQLIDTLVKERLSRYLISTSQATDIIHGGIKSNALPESVSVVVNSRINVDSSVKTTQDKIVNNVLEIADKFDLGVIVSGETIKKPTNNGYFNYTVSTPLKVAPISPWSGEFWDLFAGSLRHFYEDVAYPDTIDSPIVVTPGLSTGNTDTKYYWRLTKNIYRYEPGDINSAEGLMRGIHSVDEYSTIESHLNIVAFYYEFIKNVDAAASS